MTLEDAYIIIYSALDDKGELPENLIHHPSSLFLEACELVRKSSKAERKVAMDKVQELAQESLDSERFTKHY